MLNEIEEIKSKNLLEFIQRTLWQNWKKDNKWYWFLSGEEKTASLLVYEDNSRWYWDYSKQWWWSIIDFYMNFYNCDQRVAIKNLKEIYKIESEKKEFVKQPKREGLFTNFEKYKLQTIEPLSRFLQKRWFKFEQIKENIESIENLSKELWFFAQLFIEKWVYKDTLIFPCYDENQKIKGCKLRTCDLTFFKNSSWKEIKSPAIKHTWLLYKQEDLNKNQVIICEGEVDYLTLKALWINNIIANLGWVQANKNELKYLTKEIKEVVSFYDNDIAWQQANQELQKELWRQIKIIQYPTTDKVDVNDLFKRWFLKKDFEKLIENAIQLEKKDIQKLYKNRFFYDDTNNNFFDLKKFSFLWNKTLADILFLKPKEIQDLRMEWLIPTYDWLCYYKWWKDLMYNLYSDDNLIKPSNNPVINPILYEFLASLFWYNEQNIEWIMKAILYKYTHINDVYIPAVIMHWPWWSGKWLFIKLLEQIFWKKNVLKWLWQSDINSQFTTYSGQKLIVSFNEVLVDWTANWKKNMAKLKNLIMEEEIAIEKKWQDKIFIENIAWFFLSSNESKPVQLDWSSSWNRRFTVMKTWKKLLEEEWKRIEEIIMDEKNVEDFISFLFESFPNTENEKYILPLDNQDKRDLEELCDSIWNLFFKWFEEKFPNINKITNKEREILLNVYRNEISEYDNNDNRYNVVNFNSWLSFKYKKINEIIWAKKTRWYKIDKEVEGNWFFPENYIKNNFLEDDF